MNSSLASLFDTFSSQLQLQLAPKYEEQVTVQWSDETVAPPAELFCWSWILSIDSTSRIIAAAPVETWRELCNLGEYVSSEDLQFELQSLFTPAVESTVQTRFGSEVTFTGEAGPELLPSEWTAVPFTVRWSSGRELQFQVSVNPDLEAALGAPEEPELEIAAQVPARTADLNSAEILMDVEMPVSISLGRTKLRLKDLLEVTSGSVVELDQDLSDEVEIRVNSHLIAYGEVVAVDGNYAVRVVRMAQKNPGLPGILPERAA